MNDRKKPESFVGEAISWTITLAVAFVCVCIAQIFKLVLMPLLRFAFKKIVGAFKRKPAVEVNDLLPTPNVFKGASNLARAKDITF